VEWKKEGEEEEGVTRGAKLPPGEDVQRGIRLQPLPWRRKEHAASGCGTTSP
jgi:hypothetical protein